jgi:hypothetical protein
LLLCGALLLIQATHLTVPVTESLVIPLAGPVVALLAGLARATAFLLAATGVHRELGLAGRSKLGLTALVVWGLRDVTFLAIDALPVTGPLALVFQISAPTLQVLFAAAALTAAIAIARAHVLAGRVRWVLLPLATVEVLLGLLFNAPATPLTQSLALTLASLPAEYVEAGLILLIAIALLTWGRTEALKHNARTVHDAW